MVDRKFSARVLSFPLRRSWASGSNGSLIPEASRRYGRIACLVFYACSCRIARKEVVIGQRVHHTWAIQHYWSFMHKGWLLH